jgi:hypothetical protein
MTRIDSGRTNCRSCLHEQILREHLRDDGGVGGIEERVPDPVHRDQHPDVPELELARDRQHAHHADRHGAEDVGEDHQQPPVDAVGDDAGEEDGRDLGEEPGHADDREGGRRVRDVVDLPGERDRVDAVTERRNGHSRPQEPEIANAKRAKNPDCQWASSRARNITHSGFRLKGANC